MPERPSFGTDNYATFYVFNNINLIIGEIRNITNIGIKGVGGDAVAAGIGTIHFIITNQDRIRDKIPLDNMIYLPDYPKHLHFITR